MRTDCLLRFGVLIFIFLLSCQKESNILPVNARLKQVLLYNLLTSTEPIDTIEEYEYNESGQISKMSTPVDYNLYAYNSSGQLDKITNYYSNTNSPTGFIILKIYTYSYRNDGRKEKEFIEYPRINNTEYSLFSYTEGRLTRIEKYDTGNKLKEVVQYEHDGNGRPVKEIMYTGNNIPFQWTINSFSNGLMIKSETYKDEAYELKVREIKRTYDENKNLKILESIEGPNSSLISHVLRYKYVGE